MTPEHFYQCIKCRKVYSGEDGFEDAKHCCPSVRQLWKCPGCEKVHKSKDARQAAQTCCTALCCLCLTNKPEKGKSACRGCIKSASKHQIEKSSKKIKKVKTSSTGLSIVRNKIKSSSVNNYV